MRTTLLAVPAALVLTAAWLMGGAGPLNPPAGAVAPTAKPLAEVEPRTAINAANTPGDADSLFKITQPGSYYLTGNVTGVTGKYGIEIAASGVTLDLNGFDLIGVAGALDGVYSNGGSLTNLTVSNGSVRNWGGLGVNLASSTTRNSRVSAVQASGNGSVGIDVGNACVVTGCTVFGNGSHGIDTSNAGVVTGCTSYQNTGYGIVTSGGSAVMDSTSYGNTLTGISVSSGSTVSRCTVRANAEFGIGTSSQCTVADCTVSVNTRDGIRCAGEGSQIRGNVCSGNGINAGDGAGIVVVSIRNHIEANCCSGNDRGIDVQAAGNIIIRNTCSNNTVAWTIVANNVYGPIINRSAPASAAVNGSSAASTLASTDSNANFTF